MSRAQQSLRVAAENRSWLCRRSFKWDTAKARAGTSSPGLDKPLGTVVAGGGKHAVVGAFLAKHYGGNYQAPAWGWMNRLTQ
jgi:hypothetical protein